MQSPILLQACAYPQIKIVSLMVHAGARRVKAPLSRPIAQYGQVGAGIQRYVGLTLNRYSSHKFQRSLHRKDELIWYRGEKACGGVLPIHRVYRKLTGRATRSGPRLSLVLSETFTWPFNTIAGAAPTCSSISQERRLKPSQD
jgi:hypothetical protein